MEKSIAADDYLRSFYKLFPVADTAELNFQQINDKFIVEYARQHYIVAHYNDFYKALKSYFDDYSYDEISLLPAQLWDELIKGELEDLSNTDWLTNLYREWKNYWKQSELKKEYIKNDKQR